MINIHPSIHLHLLFLPFFFSLVFRNTEGIFPQLCLLEYPLVRDKHSMSRNIACVRIWGGDVSVACGYGGGCASTCRKDTSWLSLTGRTLDHPPLVILRSFISAQQHLLLTFQATSDGYTVLLAYSQPSINKNRTILLISAEVTRLFSGSSSGYVILGPVRPSKHFEFRRIQSKQDVPQG